MLKVSISPLWTRGQSTIDGLIYWLIESVDDQLTALRIVWISHSFIHSLLLVHKQVASQAGMTAYGMPRQISVFHQQRGRQQPRHQRHHRGNRQQHRHSHRQQPHSDQHCWQSSRQSPYIITSGNRFAVWIEQSCVTVRYDGIRDAASDHTFDVIGHVRGRARGGEGRGRGERGRVCWGRTKRDFISARFVWFLRLVLLAISLCS